MSLVFFLGSLLATLAAVALFFWGKSAIRQKLRERFSLQLFSIRLFKQGEEGGVKLEDEINRTEQLFSSLAALEKPFVFEVAVPHVGEEIHFYIAIAKSLEETLVRQVRSLWGDAEIARVSDYNIFNHTGFTSVAWIKQKERFVLPIRTYRDLSSDTFLPLIGGLSEINAVGEGGAFQFVVRKAPEKERRAVQTALQALRKGRKLKDVLSHPHSISFSDIKDSALKGHSKEKKDDNEKTDESAVRGFEMKAGKPLFEVNIRVLASAPSQFQSDAILGALTNGFSQFGAPDRNELRVVKPRTIRDITYAFSFRSFDPSRTVILNTEELASIFHLPTSRMSAIPRVKYVKARESAAPISLPTEGTKIGESVFRGSNRDVKISDDDRRRHVYVVGQTGTGKTTLLSSMAISDIRRGKGVCIIDPHGSLIDEVLEHIPQERFNDVVIIDPGDLERPVGLNMLEYDTQFPEQKTFVVNEMLSIFDKLYDLRATGGPMFEQYMRNALQLLMEDVSNEGATLVEVPRLFTDAEFRKRKLARITNPLVIDFWEKEAAKAGGDAALANITPYITSKFNVFLSNDYVRPMIGQIRSSINFRNIMDEGKILLVNLSKGRIGEINAQLLGMVIIGKILMAAFSRVGVPESSRRDFNLFVDEFQNFTTNSVAGILSEARKYRLNLTVAHQFIDQLTEEIRSAVFGNVGSIIALRVGPSDAEFLVKHFAPTFSTDDLINIDNFKAYVKLLVGGATTEPFNIRIPRIEGGNKEIVEPLRKLSRANFGAPRTEVEADIMRRLRA